MNEKVSVIIPVYNSSQTVGEAIRSVIDQTYSNWEMILVDDGSADQSVSVIKEFQKQDPRIYLIELKKNCGSGVARNEGVRMARGRYIAFLDADDLWKKQKLEKQIRFLKTNRLYVTFSFYEWIDKSGNPLHTLITAPDPLRYEDLKFGNYIGNLTGIYDSSFFGKVIISPLRKRQDWIMWLVILEKVKIAYPVSENLASYRLHENSLSASKIKLLKYNYRVYRDHFQKNRFISGIFLIRFLIVHFFEKNRFRISLKSSKFKSSKTA